MDVKYDWYVLKYVANNDNNWHLDGQIVQNASSTFRKNQLRSTIYITTDKTITSIVKNTNSNVNWNNQSGTFSTKTGIQYQYTISTSFSNGDTFTITYSDGTKEKFKYQTNGYSKSPSFILQ